VHEEVESVAPVQWLKSRGMDVPHWYEKFVDFVLGPRGETISAVLVILNVVNLAFKAQIDGETNAVEAALPPPYGYESEWFYTEDVFLVVDLFLGVAFSVELVVKMMASHVFWFVSAWNWLDFFIVVAYWLDNQGTRLPFPPLLGRLLRLFKIARLARVVKMMSAFDALRVLLATLKQCFGIAFWSLTVLSVPITMGCLVMNVLTKQYILSGADEGSREDMWEYFGTFTRSMVTMMEISIANWVPVVRKVQGTLGEPAAFCVIVYVLIVNFCMLKVVTGVFLQQTYQASAEDDELMVMKKIRETKVFHRKMKLLFKRLVCDKKIDGDKEAVVTIDDFNHALVKDRTLKPWMASMNMDVADAKIAWRLVDLDNNGVTQDELMNCVRFIRGQAKSADVKLLLQEVSHMVKLLKSDRN
jgi:hypothetical protein